MAISWLSPGSADVGELVARKSYSRAANLLRARVEKDPADVSLQLQLADVLELDGRGAEAVLVLMDLADRYARNGFVAKAVALLKKVQRVDPAGGIVLDRKIAALAKERDEEAFRKIRRREAVRETARSAVATAGRAELPRAPGSAEARVAPTEVLVEAAAEVDLSALDEPEPTPPDAGETLGRTPLFSAFSGDELLEVIRGLRLLSFEPGDVVVAEGEPGDSLFVLTTGSVKAFCRDPRGQYRKVREMGEGSFFGEVSILTGRRRSATITAATHVELLELDTPTLEEIAGRHPNVVTVLRDFCSSRAGSLEEIRVRMGRTSPPPAPDDEAPPGRTP